MSFVIFIDLRLTCTESLPSATSATPAGGATGGTDSSGRKGAIGCPKSRLLPPDIIMSMVATN